MNIKLTPNEARIIGVLLEKEITTPDQYPLSLNALLAGCNQKSNREPALELDESTVQATLDDLKKRHLVSDQSGLGSRVTKYRHRFCNAEIGGLQIAPIKVAILCELLLRGPQTPGQLRIHTERLHAVADVAEVEKALQQLMEEDDPLVASLPKGAGQREIRFIHLLGSEEPAEEAVPNMTETAESPSVMRIDRLEQEVDALRQEVMRLRQLMEGDAG
jgi:uncharacterized protein YceH (UPF0502 family)